MVWAGLGLADWLGWVARLALGLAGLGELARLAWLDRTPIWHSCVSACIGISIRICICLRNNVTMLSDPELRRSRAEAEENTTMMRIRVAPYLYNRKQYHLITSYNILYYNVIYHNITECNVISYSIL